MINFNRCWLGGLAMAMMLFPSGVAAQTAARSLDEFEGSTLVAKANASFTQVAPQGVGEKGLSRSKKIAIGAAIGAGIGAVFGEYQFGRKMDMPHGPDMLLGAGLGAGVGAVITRILTRDGSATNSKSSVSAFPVVSASRKAWAVTLALK
jgi:hypothetical protein